MPLLFTLYCADRIISMFHNSIDMNLGLNLAKLLTVLIYAWSFAYLPPGCRISKSPWLALKLIQLSPLPSYLSFPNPEIRRTNFLISNSYSPELSAMDERVAAASEKARVQVRPARTDDIPSLVPIFPESFHPVSPYILQCFPDTLLMRQWWEDVHTRTLRDPETRLLVAFDTSNNKPRAIAFLRYRVQPRTGGIQQLDAGTWSRVPLGPDHYKEGCDAFVAFLAEARQDLMRTQPHFFVELLCTSHEFKGRGAGRLLVERMCHEADAAGQPCFVETNGAIVKFYEKFGFEVKATRAMPGSHDYVEYILVRPVRGRKKVA